MSLLGKKAPPVMPPWHPDFRDRESLPDVKVVRTSFFINGVSVLLLVIVAIYLTFQEIGRSDLKNDLRAVEENLAEHETRNQQLLQLNRSFTSEQRYLTEVADYLDGSLELSQLLVALGESLPSDMALSGLRYQRARRGDDDSPKEVLINGSIRATPDVAASAITDYLSIFEENPFLKENFAEAVPVSLVPAQEGDLMAFSIRLKLRNGQEEEEE